jgi:hypothetical protein
LIPIYYYRSFEAHGLNVCEVRVTIPFQPTVSWKEAIIGSEVDDAIKKMTHVALTSLHNRSLTTTADMPIALFLICNPEVPEWQQCHEATCELTSPHFSIGWAQMTMYMRYLFNLQHNTGRIIIEQCTHLNAYAGQATLTSHTMVRLERDNAILCCGTRVSMEKDLELQVMYRHLCEAENDLNYAHQQIDLASEEVDTHTHAIMHLENAIEMWDNQFEERAEMFANLEQ